MSLAPGSDANTLEFDEVNWHSLKLESQNDSDSGSGLCNSCANILSALRPFPEIFMKAMAKQCWLCDAIRESCRRKPGSEESDPCSRCTIGDDDDDDDDHDNSNWQCYIMNYGPNSISYRVSHGNGNLIHNRKLSIRKKTNHVGESGLDPRILSFVRSKLKSCLEHADCHQAENLRDDDGLAATWPARMIRIKNDDTVRVVPFDPSTMAGEYASLSYCAGPEAELQTNPPYKMTLSTMAELQSEAGVPVQRMPLTLQQAFRLCRVLGIGYIWVDSLCVLQPQDENDSLAKLDRELESTKTETVFSRSKLNIIAASGASCHDGFMHWNMDRGTTVIESVSSSVMPRGLQLVAQEWDYGAQVSCGFHHRGDDPCRNPLSQRAGALQEEIWSSRYVKFTKEDVQWRCGTETDCMCGEPIQDSIIRDCI